MNKLIRIKEILFEKASLPALLFLLTAIIAFGSAYFFISGRSKITAASLDKYAAKIVEKCSSVQYKPGCYEEEVPKLMDSISMEEAFQVTRLIQDKDRSYAYCHVLGHELSARETAKDPDKWKDVITRCPSGLCSNGCIHGAFQERFRAEALSSEEIDLLKPDLKHICEPKENWQPTGLERGTCYHALGHLLMYISSADINYSIRICKEVSVDMENRDWSQLCYDGAFMQIFQPLEQEDFALVAGKQPKKNELASFCKKFSAEERGPCWNEGWPLFRDEILTPKGLVNFCSRSILKNQAEEDRCYLAMFYVITAQFQFDLDRMKVFCNGLPVSARKNQCFANAASRMIETDYRNIPLVINWCSGVLSADGKDVCFQELILYSVYNFHAGSPEFFQLCGGLPEPWKSECLNGYPRP